MRYCTHVYSWQPSVLGWAYIPTFIRYPILEQALILRYTSAAPFVRVVMRIQLVEIDKHIDVTADGNFCFRFVWKHRYVFLPRRPLVLCYWLILLRTESTWKHSRLGTNLCGLFQWSQMHPVPTQLAHQTWQSWRNPETGKLPVSLPSGVRAASVCPAQLARQSLALCS